MAHEDEARDALRNAFDLVELWLSYAPEGFEHHDPDWGITTKADAERALDALRMLVLGESTMVVG